MFKRSRYANVPVTSISYNNENRFLFNHRNRVSVSDLGNEYFLYTVTSSDTLESIAFKMSKKSSLYYIIADINRISYPENLKVGQRLIVPTSKFFSKFK